MLDALVTAVDNKDRYTRRHSEDVLAYSLQIARGLGLDAATQHIVAVAALLHDVGKIGVPDAILRKPGRLTEEEFEAVQQHPLMGAVIVGAVPGFEDTLDAIRHHHERWDGEGYPVRPGGRGDPLPRPPDGGRRRLLRHDHWTAPTARAWTAARARRCWKRARAPSGTLPASPLSCAPAAGPPAPTPTAAPTCPWPLTGPRLGYNEPVSAPACLLSVPRRAAALPATHPA